MPRFIPTAPASSAVLAWEAVRRPGRHSDESLTGTTRRWLHRLPAGRRPLRLCEQFPRVANRIAWHWTDAVAVREVLADLLEDRRGGRRGFPAPVVQELRRLRELLDRCPPADDDGARTPLQAWRRLWQRH